MTARQGARGHALRGGASPRGTRRRAGGRRHRRTGRVPSGHGGAGRGKEGRRAPRGSDRGTGRHGGGPPGRGGGVDQRQRALDVRRRST
ncbi:hypothetical protein STTU_1382 [Streptomyces sp. Tu6071]|nr:hypothetical protein STTU_1382 [Streptomyces sp. Tu6071]